MTTMMMTMVILMFFHHIERAKFRLVLRNVTDYKRHTSSALDKTLYITLRKSLGL